MTDKAILKKAIEKAYNNGYSKQKPYYIYPDEIGLFIADENRPYLKSAIVLSYYEIIFSHDFAKAFWGMDNIVRMDIDGNRTFIKLPIHSWDMHRGDLLEYEYHLQQMVLEEEPLKYLEKFL